MKKILFLIPLLLLLFVSCDEENLWQKLNITKKPELGVITPAIQNVETKDNKVDIVRIFSTSSSVTFNVTTTDAFTKKIISKQDKGALDHMVERLLSKAFTEHEISSFLSSTITNEDITLALKGNAELLSATKEALVDFLTAIPLIDKSDESVERYLAELGLELNQKNKDMALGVIESYNSYINSVKDGITKFLNNLFAPLENYVNVDSYLWCDYIRIQLTTNIVASLIEALSDTFSETHFDLSDKSSLDEVYSYLEDKSIEGVYNLALNIIKRMINPIAGMDQLASRYKESLSLPDLKDIINLALGGEI